MPEEIPTNEPQDDELIGSASTPPPNAGDAGTPEASPPQAIPSDQIEAAGSVDDEVERIMLEELARAEAADKSAPATPSPSAPPLMADPTIAETRPLPTVKQVQFEKFHATELSGTPKNIEILMDVRLPVSIELGRTEMPIRDILELSSGSVVELNKLAGEPVDLLVNNKIIAKGEVVVVDENFGLRVTSLMSPEDRIKSL